METRGLINYDIETDSDKGSELRLRPGVQDAMRTSEHQKGRRLSSGVGDGGGTMVVSSVSAFVKRLQSVPILDAARLSQLEAEAAPFDNPTEFAKHLIRSGWITLHQGRKLLAGRPDQLVIGPYLITDKLGEGGMGKVYKATHRRLNRVVALKVLRSTVMNDPRVLKRFHREAQAAARLEHPNIVRIYDAHEENGQHYLVMEFINGMDLCQLVQENGTLPVYLACEYIRQAAIGLQHAHEQGLIHRDIKPANLLLSSDSTQSDAISPHGVVKILDMGLARPSLESGIEESGTSVTQDGTVVGTPDFMAPEQAKNSKTVDGRADIYSLGCTLYFLLTGKPPFGGETTMEKLLAHQAEEPPSITVVRPDTPPALVDVLACLMAKHPGGRFPTAAAVAAALEPLAIPTADAVHTPPPVRSRIVADPAARLSETEGTGTPTSVRRVATHPASDDTHRYGSPFVFDTQSMTPSSGTIRRRPKPSNGMLFMVLSILLGIGIIGLTIIAIGSTRGWFVNPSEANEETATSSTELHDPQALVSERPRDRAGRPVPKSRIEHQNGRESQWSRHHHFYELSFRHQNG